MGKELDGSHYCTGGDFKQESGNHGPAIEYCFEQPRGQFWVDNGEYASRVNYCPYCGEKAPDQMEKFKAE